ncbi:hypothetical protein V6N12_076475 [Hibiscus sabdariffa]|uniref:Uncharacterized protein n=1 Tax=Hibiscus sabdariffa TaxID=183260 RepID=A0ABR2D9X1_9ROSI
MAPVVDDSDSTTNDVSLPVVPDESSKQAFSNKHLVGDKTSAAIWDVVTGSSLSSEDLSSFQSSSIRVLAPSLSTAGPGVDEGADHAACAHEAVPIVDKCVPPVVPPSPICTVTPEAAPMTSAVPETEQDVVVSDSPPMLEGAAVLATDIEIPQIVIPSSDAEHLPGACVDESQVDSSHGSLLGSNGVVCPPVVQASNSNRQVEEDDEMQKLS